MIITKRSNDLLFFL